jgi:acetyl esterase/lipase
MLSEQSQVILDSLREGRVRAGSPGFDLNEARRIQAQTLPDTSVPLDETWERHIQTKGQPPLRVRGYRPPHADPKLPVLVFFHGGGWVMCGIETHDALCRYLARAAGRLVVSVDYRLAPEHPHPAAVEDAYRAANWVSTHARELGTEHAGVVLCGDSAGAHLAAVCAVMARDRGGPAVIGQLLLYPATDAKADSPSYDQFNDPDAGYLSADEMRWFWAQYAGQADLGDPYVSPARADTRGLAPAFIVAAEHDPLRDDAFSLGAALAGGGVDVEVAAFAGTFHGFVSFAGVLDVGSEAIERAIAWLMRL